MTRPRSNNDSHRPSRRDFLKTSGVIAGATLAGNLAVARTAHAQGSDILKVGLVGCGSRGTGAASNALTADPNTKLIAMGDLFEAKVKDRRARLQKIHPNQVAVDDEHCFVGFDAYQKVIDSDVDVVVLGEFPHFRPQHLKAAIEAGKHVFAEKPVAVDAPGVRSVLESAKLAEEKGVSIVAGLCWRYYPPVQEILRRVADGEIGPLRNIQSTYLFGLVGRPTPRTDQMTEMEYQLRNWWHFCWLSGDHNTEQHVHSLDKALWAMGNEPPVAAWGSGGRQVTTFNDVPKPGDAYDHHAVSYEYPGGLIVNSHCRQQANCHTEVTDRLFGAKGTGKIDSFDVAITDLDGKRVWRHRGPKANMYVLEHEALFKAIRSGKPINDGKNSAYSTMMAILGRMCTYTGQRITWDDAINSKEALLPSEYSFDGQPPTLPNENGQYPIAMPGKTKFV